MTAPRAGPGVKTIYVDFDGVLHAYVAPFTEPHIISDGPVPGAIEWLRQLIADERFVVSIFSSRNAQRGGIQAIESWLHHQGLSLDEIDRLEFPCAKGAAWLTIDDRAYQFQGTFPALDIIDAFRPWNRPRGDL